MITYPTHPTHDLLTEQNLDTLCTDAKSWNTLLTELTARGFANLTLDDIVKRFDVADFPHDQTLTATPNTPPIATNQTTAPALQSPPERFLDAFLTPRAAETHPKPLATIQRTQPVEVREFAEAETTLGTVTIGYTPDGQLAFTFQHTNETYLVPVISVLADVMSAIVTRKPILTRPTQPVRPM